MAARTALTAQAAVRNGGVLLTGGATPDATNGNIVASPGAFHADIIIYNGDNSSHSVIVRATGYAGLPTGAGNSGYTTDQYQPFAEASAGDLTFAVTATTYAFVGPLDTDRFGQSDGSLWLDWTASTSVLVWVIQKPYMP
jgi:hypothetical protein